MKQFVLTALLVLGAIASIPFFIGLGSVIWEAIREPVRYVLKCLFAKKRGR